MRGLFIVTIGLARTAGALSYNAPLSAVSRVSSPSMMAKSKALPFLEQPAHLDGSMAGDVGFDPLGLGSAYNMKWMREAELKHGRVCMLAFIGFCSVDLGFRAPGAPAVSSLAAHDVTVASGHMLALLITIGVFEFIGYAAIYEMLSGESDRAPGDYGFDPRARAALSPPRAASPVPPHPALTSLRAIHPASPRASAVANPINPTPQSTSPTPRSARLGNTPSTRSRTAGLRCWPSAAL